MKKRHVLVVSEGQRNFWDHQAIGFHQAGCRVSYLPVRLNEGGKPVDNLALMLAARGEPFDLVVTNQAMVNAFAFTIRDNPTIDWGRLFPRIVMTQFHDVTREMPTLHQAPMVFGRHGVRFTYNVCCRETFDLLDKLSLFPDRLLTRLPVSFDVCLQGSDFDLIGDIEPLLRPRPAPITTADVSAFSAGMIYIGAYYFDKRLVLRPDGPCRSVDDFVKVLNQYLPYGRDRKLAFTEYLYDLGMMTIDQFLNSTAAEYTYNFGGLIVLPKRLEFVTILKKNFGSNFHLYGPDWANWGLDCFPVDKAADDDKYRNAFISVDFGSTLVDTSIYQRTQQILSSGGRLLQLRQTDADEVFGPFVDLVSFESAEDLLGKLGMALADPIAFLVGHADFADFMRTRHDPGEVCRTILRHVGLNPP